MMKKVATGLFFVYVSCLLVPAFFGQIHALKEDSPERKKIALELGQKIEREDGDKDYYRVNLTAGQFIKIEVEQTDCDVVLMFMSPTVKNLHEVRNQTSGQGTETAEIAVSESGEYELRVLRFAKPTPTSRYVLKIAELRQATEKELNFTAGIALFNEGFDLGTSNSSADSQRQAIVFFEQAAEKFRLAGDVSNQSLSFNNIATRYERIGKRGKAIEYFGLALKGFRSINSESSIARQLGNLGMIYSTIGDWQKSFDALFESLSLSSKIKDKRGEAFSLSRIGGLYEATGDLQKAEDYYKRAAKSFQEFNENHNQALEESKIGKILYAAENFSDALKHFQQALDLARLAEKRKAMALGTGVKRTEAMLFSNIGRTFVALGERDKGLQFLGDALAADRSLGDKIGEAATLRYLGQIYFSMGEIDKSLEFLSASLEKYREVEDTQNAAETLLWLSKAEANKGDLDTAQNSSEEAIKLIETLRGRIQTAGLRDSFSANLQDFYGFYIEILMRKHAQAPDKNFAAAAFEANEKRKARGLLNLLAESNANIREGVNAELLEKETELRDLLSARLEILTKVLSGKPKPENVKKLKDEIEKIRLEYEQIQGKIRVSSPRYAALTQPKTLDLGEIQKQVLDNDSVLLEYALGEAKSYLWVVSKNDFRLVELPAKADIEKTARQFYESLTARNKQIKFETEIERSDRIFQTDSDLQRLSGELSRMILAPAAPYLNGKRLLIVADGALQYVPFASLVNPKSKVQNPKSKQTNSELKTQSSELYLVETNEIINLPSASVLAVLRRETQNRKLPAKTLAVLADPIFDKEDERFQTIAGKNKPKTEYVAVSKKRTRAADFSLTRNGLDLPRLPFTRREADLISANVPENQRGKFLDFAANRSSAMSSDLSNFRYVHFATHGFINNENPELSGIVFSMIDETGKDLDGFLRVGDIYNLKLPAEMVVLSGCRTGLGKEIKGEGLVGLTRGFMYAGAKRVTVSLWDVNDEATSELMTRFYREMLGDKKLSPASALRQAQISMIKSKQWSNPYFWATFVLQGEPK